MNQKKKRTLAKAACIIMTVIVFISGAMIHPFPEAGTVVHKMAALIWLLCIIWHVAVSRTPKVKKEEDYVS